MANTPATDRRPDIAGYYICKVRRFSSGGSGWVAVDAVLYWDSKHWWMDSLHIEDFDGIYDFRGPLMLHGEAPKMDYAQEKVEYSQ